MVLEAGLAGAARPVAGNHGAPSPPLVSEFRLPGGWPLPVGVIFTTRGCSFQCTFCQTTAFAPRPKAIPLEAIERVVRFYVARGIRYALILDENFGNIPDHAEAVI